MRLSDALIAAYKAPSGWIDLPAPLQMPANDDPRIALYLANIPHYYKRRATDADKRAVIDRINGRPSKLYAAAWLNANGGKV